MRLIGALLMPGRSGRSTRPPGPWRLDQPPPRDNRFALSHGANSPRSIEAEAERVRAALIEVCPWLDQPEYAMAVSRFLRAEARALLLHAHIERVCEEQGAARVAARVWEQATAADRLAAQLGNVLGLDPTGKSRLQALVAGTELAVQTLGKLAQDGAAIAERRLAELEAENDE